ncbi:MAG: M1 family metallopeptidase [Reichenbachiella sp.]
MKKIVVIVMLAPLFALAQGKWDSKFEQLGTSLPTPNTYRTASGAPGSEYWQQKADYVIEVELDDKNQTVKGLETITYFNNSPDVLTYIWLQLDQNKRAKDSDTPLAKGEAMKSSINGKDLQTLTGDTDFNGGFNIESVNDNANKPLDYWINKTMMRVVLPTALKSGEMFSFKVKWNYEVQDRMQHGGRSGYEYFPKDDNYLYTIAQWFPRMAVYDNVEGWQNKQFLGNGEFALEFGDYKVDITVPADFVVASTGELKNPEKVLTNSQIKRFEEAKKSFDKPVFVITAEEALANEKSRLSGKKTWTFHAENVRDFAFAASRKFIWDAQAVEINGKKPLAMSFYSKEGNPLWEKESTKAIINTLKTYSKYTIDYPYPVAISVHAASIGMEYPMICFNWGRPDEKGNYTKSVRDKMIRVVIHEVGHNFFPMIINSDERQWTWMDEGLNSFVETVTEKEHYPDVTRRRGDPRTIVDYMKGDKLMIRPIMTNSEQLLQFGNNAYGKPAAALTILRETIMGEEMFDYAFKTYSERWAFKHPTPADFFRSMEDASAMDLDWFWKGWFYSTDNVDISLDKVKWFKIEVPEAMVENKPKKGKKGKKVSSGEISETNEFQMPEEPNAVTFLETDKVFYKEFMNTLDDAQIMSNNEKKNFYELTFSNKGGLVSPLIIQWTYEDGTQEVETIPVEIWRKNENRVVKVFAKDLKVTNIVIDPNEETADVNTQDNFFPRMKELSEFDGFQSLK